MNAQEHYKTEKEMEEELTESYGTVTVGHLEIDAGRLFREFDVPFFDGCIAESLQWECEACGKLYDEYDKESAEECCIPECDNCGKKVKENDNFGTKRDPLCESCYREQEEEEEEEENT